MLTIEEYMPKPGYVEVRLRENINAISETDKQTGDTVKSFEYDEYVFHLKNKRNLKEEIEANMDDWLITGRTLEVNENASMVQDMRNALEILGVSE